MCFFGQIKNTGPEQLQSYLQMVLDPFITGQKCGRVDVYFHSYQMEEISNPRTGEDHIHLNVGESSQLLMSTLQSRQQVRWRALNFSHPEDADNSLWPLDYYLSHGDPWPENKRVSMRNLLRQFYSLDYVTRLWWSHRQDYKAVLYTRPDLLFKNKLSVTQSLDHNKLILVPEFDWHRGINDRFAVGSAEAMVVYGQRMRWIEAYFKDYPKGMLHAERFLKVVMSMNRIKVARLKGFMFVRVRADGSYRSTRLRVLRGTTALS